MTAQDPIAKAKALPAGAVFHRCALQVNPHHYGAAFRGQSAGGDASGHAQAIVEKAVEIGVSVLAITDHNDVSGVPAFRNAAQGRGVQVFPGFELTSSDGVHVLCIYPQDTNDDQLQRYLGEFGIRTTSPSSDLANKSFVAILGQVREQHGVTIAAHVTNDKGLFKVLSSKPRILAWRCEDLLAIQIPGPVEDLPQDVPPDSQERQFRLSPRARCGRQARGCRGQREGHRETRGSPRPVSHLLDQDVRIQHRGVAAGLPRSGLPHPPQSQGRQA